MYQVKWINIGVSGIYTSGAEYNTMEGAVIHGNRLEKFMENTGPVFAWVEPVFTEPAPSRLEWEDIDYPGKVPMDCPIDPIAQTQEAVSRLVESGHVSSDARRQEALDRYHYGEPTADWMQYMTDMYPEYDQEEVGIVDMIASGYEFHCYECGEWTKVPEWTQIVQCQSCCTTFRANDPEHDE